MLHQSWTKWVFAAAATLAVIAGCTRNIGVNPNPVYVMTFTATATPANTFTTTPTPITESTSMDPSAPSNTTVLPGAASVPVLEISVNNTGNSSANLTSITLLASGSGNDATGIAVVNIYDDTNDNGIFDGADTFLNSGTYSVDNGTLVLSINDVIPANTTGHILVTYTFTGGASGTFTAQVTNLGGTNNSTGLPVSVTGLPVSGAVITLTAATATTTNSPTNSPSNSPTATPTTPGANSATPTNTPTNSPTKTPTNSPTNTIPGANTNTPTNTPTNSPTKTPSNSPTNSPTNTVTNTPTTSACPLPLALSYTFDANIGCWSSSNQLGGTTTDWASAPPAGSTSGGGAFHANVTYSPSAQLTEEFEVALPANTDLTGKIVSFKIYIDSSVQGTAWGGGIQPYVKTTSLYSFCNQAWTNISGFGGWYTYTLDLTANCTSNLDDVRALGVQVIIASGGGSGNIYIDDVTITSAGGPTDTPTPTATPGGCPLPVASAYNFDTDINCWSTTNNQGSSSVVWNATAPAGSTSGGGALDATVTYPDTTSGAADEDFEVALPANTDLTGKVITFNVYVSAIGGASYGGMQPYIKWGDSYTFCDQTWINVPSLGAWHTYQINLSNTCTSGAGDVRAFGIQVFTGGGTGGTGHIYIDDVTVATAQAPTATPTPNGFNWTYEDNTTQYWAALDATTTGSGGCTSAVTAFGEASSYGFDMIIAPGVITNANNTFRAEVNSASGSPVMGSGLDWTSLNLTQVVVDYYINASAGYLGTQYPYVVAGAIPTRYGGTYGGAPGQCSGGAGCDYKAPGAWYSITWTPSGGSWTTDKTNVTAVGFEVNISANPTFPGEEYVLDNIKLQ